MIEKQICAGEYCVHLYFDEKSDPILQEDKRQQLSSQYSAIKHGAHTIPGQQHIHVFCKKNQLFAINFDGTAHDRSHRTRIPNEVSTALRRSFPNLVIPSNNFIESAPRAVTVCAKLSSLAQSESTTRIASTSNSSASGVFGSASKISSIRSRRILVV